MSGERRLILLGVTGVALMFAAGVSDFLTGGFWERHALLASLVANLLVVAVTVVVVNELLERRDRRRWNLLAQSVLFALLQSARATWTGLVEVLELGEVHSGAIELLVDSAKLARDLPRVSGAIRELLAVPERRGRLLRLCFGLSEHAAEVIAKWAPVMVSAGPYAEVLDRHVELAERLGWLSNVLAHVEEPPAASPRERRLVQSSVAAERADELGNDEWLHDQIVIVIRLATELDYEAREQALTLVPMSWWAERTTGLDDQHPPAGPLRRAGPLS
jgi:hypothetical protein